MIKIWASSNPWIQNQVSSAKKLNSVAASSFTRVSCTFFQIDSHFSVCNRKDCRCWAFVGVCGLLWLSASRPLQISMTSFQRSRKLAKRLYMPLFRRESLIPSSLIANRIISTTDADVTWVANFTFIREYASFSK